MALLRPDKVAIVRQAHNSKQTSRHESERERVHSFAKVVFILIAVRSATIGSAFADQVHYVYPGWPVSLTVAKGTAVLDLDYETLSGTDYEPRFNYWDTSNCASFEELPAEGPSPYQITVTHDASGATVGDVSGTTGAQQIRYSCPCPYDPDSEPCPFSAYENDEFTITPQHREINVSSLAASEDVRMTVTAVNVFARVTVRSTPPLTVQLRSVTTGTVPVLYERGAVGNEIRVRVALGTAFELGLVRKQGFLEPVLPVTSFYNVSRANIDPVPKAPTLFPNDALLRFKEAAPAYDKVTFQALHLGTTMLSLVPSAISSPPVSVVIEVIRPSNLGSQPNGWDEKIVDVSNDRGIPPQIVKGQIRQEQVPKNVGGVLVFRGDVYRYEPCSLWVGDLGAISAGPRLIDTDPYADYKLDDSIGITLFEGVRDDLDVRNRYSVGEVDPVSGATVYRRLRDTDRNITARQIWEANDTINSQMNWGKHCGVYKAILKIPDPATRAAQLEQFFRSLEFVAQTPTASSYGLLQVMYVLAIERQWAGVTLSNGDLSKAPKYLFDRDEYIAVGGGSMNLGTSVVARHFLDSVRVSRRPCRRQQAPFTYPNTFATPEEFEKFLGRAIRGYNCFLIHDGLTYDESVLKHAKKYSPSQADAIFP